MRRTFEPWDGSPIPVAQQIRGLEGARMLERELPPTTQFLTSVLGFSPLREERGWHRYGVLDGSSGFYVDLQEAPQLAARRVGCRQHPPPRLARRRRSASGSSSRADRRGRPQTDAYDQSVLVQVGLLPRARRRPLRARDRGPGIRGRRGRRAPRRGARAATLARAAAPGDRRCTAVAEPSIACVQTQSGGVIAGAE